MEWFVGSAERGIAVLGTHDLERERIEHETGCAVETVAHENLAPSVDLMLVLGGDGTMIATARMLADTEVPVVGDQLWRPGLPGGVSS